MTSSAVTSVSSSFSVWVFTAAPNRIPIDMVVKTYGLETDDAPAQTLRSGRGR